MNQIVLDSLRTLVSRRLGLHIREVDLPEFHQKLQQRLTANGMGDFGDYYRLLDSLAGEREWNLLIPLLTTGETYFFRDKGQIQLLKDRILPDIIQRRRQEQQARGIGRPSLRIWSAGCSYGEEPYTLAMLLTQLIPDIHNWDILVLGTDLNPESIQKAKRGVYGQWSFRQVDPAIVARYFTEHGSRWKVRPTIRNLVKLRSGNLVEDNFSALYSDSQDMDLIICRNVFIYFQPDTIARIVDKFYGVLRTDGYFISGHTELQGQDLSKFQTLNFDRSVAYQKAKPGSPRVQTQLNTQFNPSVSTATVAQFRQDLSPQQASANLPLSLSDAQNALSSIGSSPVSNSPVGTNPISTHHSNLAQFKPSHSTSKQSVDRGRRSTPLNQRKQPLRQPLASGQPAASQGDIDRARQEYDAKQYDRAIHLAMSIIQSEPKHFDALHLLAKAHSDRADFPSASQYAQQALGIDPTSVETLYLMACIAEAQGDLRKTKQLLKQVIYLAPEAVSAYLILGDIYQQEGDRARAAKMRQSAVNVLEKLSPDTPIEHQGEIAAAASLLSQIQAA